MSLFLRIHDNTVDDDKDVTSSQRCPHQHLVNLAPYGVYLDMVLWSLLHFSSTYEEHLFFFNLFPTSGTHFCTFLSYFLSFTCVNTLGCFFSLISTHVPLDASRRGTLDIFDHAYMCEAFMSF
jgi:hypothetical protein